MSGTSSRNTTPSCGVTSSEGSALVKWNKCEGGKREEFLSKLFDWMTVSVSNSSAGAVPYKLNSEPDLSLNQRLAKWQFIALDVNRNGVLEKKEIKKWKRSMRTVSGLRLCGKRINQYCDTNQDKRISISEWTNCLDVADGEIQLFNESLQKFSQHTAQI